MTDQTAEPTLAPPAPSPYVADSADPFAAPPTPAPPAAPSALSGQIVNRIELPSGGWAVLRDPRELRGGDKEDVLRNIEDPDHAVGAGLDMVAGMVCMLVVRWEVPYLPEAPLPRDVPKILRQLTIPDYDAMIACARPAMNLIFPKPPTPEDAGKPGSPTPPASG